MRTDLLSQHLVSSHVCCSVLWCVATHLAAAVCAVVLPFLCVCVWFVIMSLSVTLPLGAGAATCFDDYVEAQLRVHRVRAVLKTAA